MSCKVGIPRKAIAETSMQNDGLCDCTLKWHHRAEVLRRDTLCILSVNQWIFNAITKHFNVIDLLYQKLLKYQHQAENYKEKYHTIWTAIEEESRH